MSEHLQWLELPPELVYKILLQLDSRKDLASARTVCRTFATAARRLTTAKGDPDDAQLLQAASTFKSVRINAIECPNG